MENTASISGLAILASSDLVFDLLVLPNHWQRDSKQYRFSPLRSEVTPPAFVSLKEILVRFSNLSSIQMRHNRYLWRFSSPWYGQSVIHRLSEQMPNN
jgi:hypothetical protein